MEMYKSRASFPPDNGTPINYRVASDYMFLKISAGEEKRVSGRALLKFIRSVGGVADPV